MIENPVFKSCYHVEIVRPDKVFLFDEKGNRHLLEGGDYVRLAPYLCKKRNSTEEMVRRLGRKISETEIYYLLMRLQDRGFIEEATPRLPRPLAAFSHLLGVDGGAALSRLEKIPISVVSIGKISTKTFTKELKKLSLKIVPEGLFNVVLTDNYRHEKLFDLNREALQKGTPWLLMKPVGAEIWIGPLFVPHKTGCFACLYEVLRQNQPVERLVENQKKRPSLITVNRAALPAFEPMAYGLAANEIFKWVIQGENGELEGKVISYDPFSSSLEWHQLTRRVHCKACGQPPVPALSPFTIESQKKQFVEDGGHRIVSPEETYKKYRHLISPITGIVQFLKSSENRHPCTHVYTAGHAIGELHGGERPSLERLWALSAGKGKTDAQSKAGCLCEAIERYSGIFRGDEIRKKGSYRQLKEEAIHPYSFLLYSEKQYRMRESFNRDCHSFHQIPHPFDEERETEWTPVWSLTEKRFKWFPTAASYYGYPFADPTLRFCGGDSNGCASGNTKEEAVLQGFFELTERDSVALWWYSRFQRPGVDWESFKDPYIARLIDYYASIGREIWALDLTMDLNIPTFAAISRVMAQEKEEIIFGYGSHFDPKIALLRALTETNQSLPHPNTKHPSNAKNKVAQDWLQNATVEKHPYLLPDPLSTFKKYPDYTRFDSGDIGEDILMCQKIVEEKGMEMLLLDQTRPDIGLPVVRVIVPGLRHFWNRYGKGRLYDVPLQMGYVARKLREEELNPIPIFT